MGLQLFSSNIFGVTLFVEERLEIQGSENVKISKFILIDPNGIDFWCQGRRSENLLTSGVKTKAADRVFVNNIPISKYQITELDIEANLGNKEWFLSKLMLFGNGVSELKKPEDFAPGIVANTLFGGLVSLVREFPRFNPSAILLNQNIQALQPKVVENSGIAEYYLEAFHAQRVIRGENLLHEFIYFENYRLLMRFETDCIRQYVGSRRFRQIKEVVFIGSGPMPLSSTELLQYLPKNASIVNYDELAEAIELGKGLVASQNLSHRISFVQCSAANILDLNKADVVYLAALVGSSAEDKQKILTHIHGLMKPNSLIVARSATGLRTLLYHQLKPADFPQFQSFQEFHPKNKVIINSVVMAMKIGT